MKMLLMLLNAYLVVKMISSYFIISLKAYLKCMFKMVPTIVVPHALNKYIEKKLSHSIIAI